MIASLPMYDWPEVRDATDAWWAGIARHSNVAGKLQHGGDHAALWLSPELLFSQTCGYPFTHEFRGKLKLVATPHYGVDGCRGANYRSMVFARENRPLESFRGAIAAVNNPDSMSGMLALQLVFGPYAKEGRFFANAIETGGHIASMIAVRDGKADLCAIDAVCTAMAKAYRPDYLEGLVEIARSPEVPGLPYVTVAGDAVKLRQGLIAAFADPGLQEPRRRLFLTGHSLLSEKDYGRITALETAMQQAGGLKLL
ncbi:MAG: PhnD/SsuA/transferrin family substrate-binding protein [Rhizobiales bacterium]|nr:PhnD/SsuA/transferrin family substrate-binding protein [Hyphomicrobiales bacterium]